MKEITGNMFAHHVQKFADAICLTTNGFIKKDGSAVMGAGNAKQAKDLYEGIDFELGNVIKENGNKVQILRYSIPPIIVFPVKYKFWESADLQLIKISAQQLLDLSNTYPSWKRIILPRPGCYNGKRSWLSEVKPILQEILDDRFYIIALR